VDRIAVGGLRISPALAQINVGYAPGVRTLIGEYLQRLARRHINLPFLTFSSAGSGNAAALCVSASEGDVAREIALKAPKLAPLVTVLTPVAAVSIFPHRQQLVLLGHLLAVLHGERIPLLAMGSSISSFTLTLAHRSLGRTMEVLEGALILPENHAPLQSQLEVIQIPKEDPS